ncbi:MAG TPA: SPOR domain-containing protein [Candidatus Ratteibacteria bacterium]|nr:SPOR domain-containing protein [bacterium]HPC29680.1 SPOR domain-containing protein [bacterium]HRS06463.1 SPOR domain-containing protein [Candidatus Ratteibacteria bacterium]HRV04752.1 SPOR domain-containing protein [Candidatus Ratteibacteria bacterium]
MEKKTKKNLIMLGVLFLIFIFALVRAFKPTKSTTIRISQSETKKILKTDKEKPDGELFDFKEFDNAMNGVQTLVSTIEKQQESSFNLNLSRDPFSQPDIRYTGKKTETSSGSTPSEIVLAPDFKISGIVYDKNRPMIVIDDEVKAENETKSGYTISKILPDRVVLKYKDKTFVLYVDSGNGSSGEIQTSQMSDVDNVNDTVLFSSIKKDYKPILKDTTKSVIADYLSLETKNDSTIALSANTNKSNQSNKDKEKILTVQVASFERGREKNAIELAEKIISDGFLDARVEEINGLYAIRVGKSNDINSLTGLCEQLKKYSESSFVRKAFYVENRIIFPKQKSIL